MKLIILYNDFSRFVFTNEVKARAYREAEKKLGNKLEMESTLANPMPRKTMKLWETHLEEDDVHVREILSGDEVHRWIDVRSGIIFQSTRGKSAVLELREEWKTEHENLHHG